MKKTVLLVILLVAIIIMGTLSFLYFAWRPTTTEKTLKGRKILFVVSFRLFRDEELEIPRRILEDAGATIVIASDECIYKYGSSHSLP